MPMQFVSFNFHLTQLRYIKAAMDVLATYRPNGKTPAQVQTMIVDATAVKGAYQTKDTALDLARGNYHQAVQDGHTVTFQVYGIMKTRYRKVSAALGAINNLPVDDDTPQKTQDRMEKTSKLWPLLPNDPNTAAPFLPWTGMDQAAFNALFAAIVTQQGLFTSVLVNCSTSSSARSLCVTMTSATPLSLASFITRTARGSWKKQISIRARVTSSGVLVSSLWSRTLKGGSRSVRGGDFEGRTTTAVAVSGEVCGVVSAAMAYLSSGALRE